MIINQSCLSSGWEPGLRLSDNSVALVLETNPTDCHKGRMMTQKGGRKAAAGEGGRDFHARTMFAAWRSDCCGP